MRGLSSTVCARAPAKKKSDTRERSKGTAASNEWMRVAWERKFEIDQRFYQAVTFSFGAERLWRITLAREGMCDGVDIVCTCSYIDGRTLLLQLCSRSLEEEFLSALTATSAQHHDMVKG